MPVLSPQFVDLKLADLEKARAWSPRLVSKLEALLNGPDDWALYRINPVSFAVERGVDEAEAIDLFLHASKLGLFRMEWGLVCPFCGDSVESFGSLNDLHSKFDCKMCMSQTEAQLDDYIEVSFSVSPQVRECPFHKPELLSVEDYYYKFHYTSGARVPGGGPNMRDILRGACRGLSYVEAGQVKAFDVLAEPGFVPAYDLMNQALAMVMAKGPATRTPQVLRLKLGPEGFTPAMFEVSPGPLRLEVENTLDRRGSAIVVQLPLEHQNHAMDLPPRLTGNRLLNSQTFRNLFRGETIGGSEGIGVRDLTLLFTDLKGSTAMYERIGDLKAFALVQQHFDHLGKAIQSHRGAIVKTIGDAVMASFEGPLDAVKAAREMLDEIEAFNRQQGSDEIMLKIGVHHGPSIAVTLNERLDYFGGTVNIAARVQGLAEAEEICVTEGVYKTPGVPACLEGLSVAPEQANLKGISKAILIYRASPKGAATAKKAAKPVKAAAKRAKPKKPTAKKAAKRAGKRK